MSVGRLEPTFRPATEADWPSIWSVFGAVVSSGDTYPYPPDISEEAAYATWMRRDGDREATYVALLADEVVGTSYVRANGVGLTDHVANAGWMVSPDHQGRGIGRLFAEYVMDRARVLGYLAMQFNGVVATNTAAVHLWQSLGFEIVGTVPEAFRHVSLGMTPIHIMYRKL